MVKKNALLSLAAATMMSFSPAKAEAKKSESRLKQHAVGKKQSKNRGSSSQKEDWIARQSVKMKPFVGSADQRRKLLTKVHAAAMKEGVNPDIVLALIQIESGFRHSVKSHAGAKGLMQVMPFWKKEIGKPSDNLHDVDTNLTYGVKILKTYMDREKNRGGLKMALARYHGSYPKTHYSNKVLRAYNSHWDSGMDHGKIELAMRD